MSDSVINVPVNDSDYDYIMTKEEEKDMVEIYNTQLDQEEYEDKLLNQID